MSHRAVFTFLVSILSAHLLSAQTRLVKLPASTTTTGTICSRVGEVLERNVFEQTFLLRKADGQTEVVPFSRWTAFFKAPMDWKSGKPQEIEPTNVRRGDRLCIVLDRSEATSTTILVLEPLRVPTTLSSR